MKYQILLQNIGGLSLAKTTDDLQKIIDEGQSEKFAKILQNRWVIIDTNNNNRIYAKYNPHIASLLNEAHCEGWRFDNAHRCIEDSTTIPNKGTAFYEFNFEEGKVKVISKRGYRICKNCGASVLKDNIIANYCTECITTNDNIAARFSYHHFYGDYTIKEKNIDTTKTAVFGCEIERDYISNDCYSNDFTQNLKNALIGATREIYKKEIAKGKNLDRRAVFMEDSSLRNNGIEYITYPATYGWYKDNKATIQNTLDAMAENHFTYSIRTGNHIHINRDYFTTSKGKNGAKFAAAKICVLFNKFWKEWCIVAGRDEDNTGYCYKPEHKADDDVFEIVEKTLENETNHNISVNLQHRNTIEVRLFGGIANADELLLYIDIMQALAKYAKKKSLEAVQGSNFVDVFKYLTDKDEHIAAIKTRLNDADIHTHDADLDKILADSTKAGAKCV